MGEPGTAEELSGEPCVSPSAWAAEASVATLGGVKRDSAVMLQLAPPVRRPGEDASGCDLHR
jgi:hypothetical protein